MAILSAIVALLSSPEVLGLLTVVVLPLVLKVLRGIWKEKSDAREQMLGLGIEIAYACVTEVAKRTDNKIDDKVAMALGFLKDWLSANGEEIKPVDEAKARLLFQAMHAKELKDLGR